MVLGFGLVWFGLSFFYILLTFIEIIFIPVSFASDFFSKLCVLDLLFCASFSSLVDLGMLLISAYVRPTLGIGRANVLHTQGI